MDLIKQLGYQPTLYVDDGHGEGTSGKRTPKLPDGTVILENHFNRPTSELFCKLAEEIGFRILKTSPEIEDTPLLTRTNRANEDFKKLKTKYPKIEKSKLALYISFHYNAYDGVFNEKKGGIETLYYPTSVEGKKLATLIQKELIQGTKQYDRGIKPRGDLHILRETNMVAVIIEAGFMDKYEEAILMLQPQFQLEVATETITAICKYFGFEYISEELLNEARILSNPTATIQQAQEWAKKHNAPKEFIDLASLYWQLASVRGGVNPAVAYVQFAHETGFLYRDGSSTAGIDASYHNPCGLKTTEGGGDNQAGAHKRFSSWEEGITAHLDHLALYAGAPGYPKSDTPDPRHLSYIAGTAKTVEKLGGKWAPSTTYGEKLVSFLKEVEATKTPKEENANLENEISKLNLKIVDLENQLQQEKDSKIIAQKELDELKKLVKNYDEFFIQLKLKIDVWEKFRMNSK